VTLVLRATSTAELRGDRGHAECVAGDGDEPFEPGATSLPADKLARFAET